MTVSELLKELADAIVELHSLCLEDRSVYAAFRARVYQRLESLDVSLGNVPAEIARLILTIENMHFDRVSEGSSAWTAIYRAIDDNTERLNALQSIVELTSDNLERLENMLIQHHELASARSRSPIRVPYHYNRRGQQGSSSRGATHRVRGTFGQVVGRKDDGAESRARPSSRSRSPHGAE